MFKKNIDYEFNPKMSKLSIDVKFVVEFLNFMGKKIIICDTCRKTSRILVVIMQIIQLKLLWISNSNHQRNYELWRMRQPLIHKHKKDHSKLVYFQAIIGTLTPFSIFMSIASKMHVQSYCRSTDPKETLVFTMIINHIIT